MDFTRRLFCAGAAALAASPALAAAKSQSYAFTYFHNAGRGKTGMMLAISADGRGFRPVRGGEPLLVPQVGENKLLRDPSIAQDPATGLFHMVWTTGWTGVTIGHASSRNLLDWSPQKAVPVMAAYPGTANTWAPELFYDDAKKQFVIFWASTIEGAFPETAGKDPRLHNHRIYYTTTKDFTDFAPTRLFYDPGFSVIDAMLLRDSGKLYLVVKDEREEPVRKFIQTAEAQSPTGPFGPLSAPITPAWSEGPTAYRVGDEVVVLFDRYRDKRYGAVASRDWKTWRDASAEFTVPEGVRHGTVFPIPRKLYEALSRA